MRKLIQVIEKYYIVFLFLILELIGFLLLVNYNTYHQIAYLSWANDVTGGVYKRVGNITQHLQLVEVNQELADENAMLRQQLQESYLSTDDAFNPWVDTVYDQNYAYQSAKIINNELAKMHNFMMIDRGRLSGIQKQMGVINSTGIVGVVTDVSAHYSVIMSVLNPDFKLGVRLKKTGFFGILNWDGADPQYATLSNIQAFVPVNVGDTIETIGASGTFPEGLMTGIVTSFVKLEESNALEIKVKLSANVQQARHVYVLENLFEEEINTLEKGIK